MSEKYGIIASFPDTPSFYHAAEKVRDAGYKKWDTYSSFPVHGMPAAQGQPRSKVPVFTFCGGITGFCLGLGMVWFMNAFDYPLIIRGQPFFSPVFPFPIMYELTILLSAFGTLGGMFITICSRNTTARFSIVTSSSRSRGIGSSSPSSHAMANTILSPHASFLRKLVEPTSRRSQPRTSPCVFS